LDVRPAGGGPSQRVRLDDLSDPAGFLQPTADGTRRSGLLLNLEVQESASDLEFTADWTLSVSDGQVGDVDTQVDYPSLDDLTHALLPIVQTRFPNLFGDAWSDLLDAVPLPLSEQGPEGEESDSWWTALLDTAGDWFADVDLDGAKRGLELLADLVTVESTIGVDQIPDLFSGELDAGTDLLRLRFVADAENFPLLERSFDFGLSLGELGALGATEPQGSVAGALQPLATVGFGIDTDGFFFTGDSRVGGQIDGSGDATGALNELEVRLAGEFQLSPSAGFVDSVGEKIWLPDLAARLAEDVELAPGIVTGSATADLLVGLFDYVDVDGDPTNNTVHGGDVFTVRGAAALSGDLGTIDPAALGRSSTSSASWKCSIRTSMTMARKTSRWRC
jgi:hypothetical protein